MTTNHYINNLVIQSKWKIILLLMKTSRKLRYSKIDNMILVERGKITFQRPFFLLRWKQLNVSGHPNIKVEMNAECK